MSVAQKSMPPQQAAPKKGRPQASNISALAKSAAQNSIPQQHSSKQVETPHQATGLPSPRASLDNLRTSSSDLSELDSEEGLEDYHHCGPGCDNDGERHIVVLNDDTEYVLRMDLDSHPGTHKVSLVVTSQRGPRFRCTLCGLNFRAEFDRRASMTDSIASLTHSLRFTSEDGHDGSKASDVNELIPTLAHRFQTSRIIMEMARFQLKVALAFYMNRLAELEAQESIAHRLLHSANSKEVVRLWHAESTATEEVVIQGMPTIALMLGHSVSLLTPYMPHLSKLKSPADMRELESRVDGLFIRADSHMAQELETQVQEALAGQGREDKVEKIKPCS
ncbi:hypothetical protein BKA70DRAFT_1436338 [Coprinopsis sp. MPI-PUGE-AT-0042]|nr:hypothetical protein BKA70DRAFT_1436338 [Coprinopsis sp. MPI-PUGE-AT-0042]